MPDNKKHNYSKTIVASVGIIGVCTIAVLLKNPNVLFGLILVFFITEIS